MTNTEFIIRQKGGMQQPIFKGAGIEFSAVDGALILAVLTAFMGLVFLLSR